MTRIPITVVKPERPSAPLSVRMDRRLAQMLGALPPGYFFGTCVGDPVILVIPEDEHPPGLVWPLQGGAYLGTDDKV